MAGLTGLFRRGSTYYMRVVLPLNHPLRTERPTGRIVISLGSSNYREALSKGSSVRLKSEQIQLFRAERCFLQDGIGLQGA